MTLQQGCQINTLTNALRNYR